MKKLLTSVTMALTLCGLSAFGQGYFYWGGVPGSVWTPFGPGPTRGPADLNVAFFWGSGTPLVDTATGLNGVPFNYAGPWISPSLAWAAILGDSAFTLATNFITGTLVVAPVGANGAFAYNGASTFPVTGTSSTGGVVQEYLIAWSSDYDTLQAAAAGGSTLGWSAPFTYAYTSSIGTPLSIAASGFLPFGILPEPSTLALAGLGGLSFLLFRRRKQSKTRHLVRSHRRVTSRGQMRTIQPYLG